MNQIKINDLSGFQEIINDDEVSIKVRSFEEILSRAIVINYNDDMIEVPGSFVITKASSRAKYDYQVLNPQIFVFQEDEESFNSMLNLLKNEENSDVLVLPGKLIPPHKVRINLALMKERSVYVLEREDTITIDDITFTTATLEYFGSIFIIGKKIYKITPENFQKIKNLFK